MCYIPEVYLIQTIVKQRSERLLYYIFNV